MSKFLVLLILSLFLTACNNESGWPVKNYPDYGTNTTNSYLNVKDDNGNQVIYKTLPTGEYQKIVIKTKIDNLYGLPVMSGSNILVMGTIGSSPNLIIQVSSNDWLTHKTLTSFSDDSSQGVSVITSNNTVILLRKNSTSFLLDYSTDQGNNFSSISLPTGTVSVTSPISFDGTQLMIQTTDGSQINHLYMTNNMSSWTELSLNNCLNMTSPKISGKSLIVTCGNSMKVYDSTSGLMNLSLNNRLLFAGIGDVKATKLQTSGTTITALQITVDGSFTEAFSTDMGLNFYKVSNLPQMTSHNETNICSGESTSCVVSTQNFNSTVEGMGLY